MTACALEHERTSHCTCTLIPNNGFTSHCSWFLNSLNSKRSKTIINAEYEHWEQKLCTDWRMNTNKTPDKVERRIIIARKLNFCIRVPVTHSAADLFISLVRFVHPIEFHEFRCSSVVMAMLVSSLDISGIASELIFFTFSYYILLSRSMKPIDTFDFVCLSTNRLCKSNQFPS